LTCVEKTFDFGESSAGETVEHRFVVRNTGRREVEIRRLLSSCGCLTAEAPQQHLAPGEEMSIPVQISLKGLRGRIQKSVVVKSNDPRQPALVLFVAGRVRSRFSLDPERVSFGDVVAGRSPVVRVQVQADPGCEVQTVKSGAAAVNATLKPRAGGEPAVIEARVSPGAGVGPFKGSIVVSTTAEGESEIAIPVSGRVVKP